MCRGGGGENGGENQLALKQGGMYGSIYFLGLGVGKGSRIQTQEFKKLQKNFSCIVS